MSRSLTSGGHAHGGRRRRRDRLARRPDRQLHRLEAGAAGAGGQRVARPHRLRSFLEIAVEGGIERIHLGHRRRERERLVLAPGLLPIEQAQHGVARRIRVGRDMVPGARADGQQRDSGRPAQALAGAGDEDIGAAIIGVDVHAGEGRHRIHQQQRAMLAHHAPDVADRIERARGRVVMHRADDGVSGRRFSAAATAPGSMRLVVGHLDLVHLLGVALRPIAEALPVDAGDEIEHHVLAADQRGRRRLEPDRRLAMQDQRRLAHAQRLVQLVRHVLVEGLEEGVEIVVHRPRHGAQHPRVDGDRPGRQGEDRLLHGNVRHHGGALPWLPAAIIIPTRKTGKSIQWFQRGFRRAGRGLG